MQNFLLFVILFFNILLTGNGHCCVNEGSFNSEKKIDITSLDHHSSDSNTENRDRTSHHCCPICHAHIVVLQLRNDSLPVDSSFKQVSRKFFYQNFYQSLAVSSLFRPPIA